jgi:hypothetical protein
MDEPSYVTYLFALIDRELGEVRSQLREGASPEDTRPRMDALLDWRVNVMRRATG